MTDSSTKNQENTTTKWYNTAWNMIKKVTKLAYKAVISNGGAIITTSVALALGIITGGTVPIVLAAVVLGVKLVKTGLDAHKAIKTRDLDIENTALIEFATALYVQQKTLELQPKLVSTTKSLTPLELDHNGKKLTYNKSLNRVHKIVDVVNVGLDITTVAINPIKGIQAAQHIKTGIDTIEAIKLSLEIITSSSEVIASAGASKELDEIIVERLSHHPEIQEQLVNLINSGRNTEGTSYLNIEELRQQTQTIQNENLALVTTLKEDNFYKLTPTQIKDSFEHNLQTISNDSASVLKQETMATRVWHGIKNALNPNSKYHPEVKEHSGLTTAVRKEHIKEPIIKAKAVTQDDFELNKKSTTNNITLTPEQRQKDLARFKADAQQLETRLAQKAYNIGKVIHNENHSQSSSSPETRVTNTIKQRKSTSTNSR
jgi:hypothetical protein